MLFKAFKKVRTQGFIRTFELFFNRFVPAKIFRFSMGDIYEFDMEALSELDKNSDDGEFEVRPVATDAERASLRKFTWSTVPEETTKNDIGYAVFRKGTDEIVGGLWAGVGSFLEESVAIQFNFQPEQAWLYCAFIDKSVRGKGVYKKLISYVIRDLQQRGYVQALGVVQPWNKISRRMHEQHSLRVCGSMSAIRVFSKVWLFGRGSISIDKRVVTQISKPANVKIALEPTEGPVFQATSA